MKNGLAIALCLILIFGCGAALYNQHKAIAGLQTQVAELEYAQKMLEPKNAWLKEAITSLLSLGFNNYSSAIDQNHKQYLSKTGFEAYSVLLNEIQLIEKIKNPDNAYVSDVHIKGIPKLISRNSFALPSFPDENIAGTLYEYRVPAQIIIRSAASIESKTSLALKVTVGKQRTDWDYPLPDFKWIITGIKVEKEQNT